MPHTPVPDGVRQSRRGFHYVHRQVSRFVPRRVSYVLSTVVVVILVFLVANHIIARQALNLADAIIREIDERSDYEIPQPTQPAASGYLKWFPIVTFLQVGFDLPMATSVPQGYGHNYAPSSYLDVWIAVTSPPDWTAADTQRLEAVLEQNSGGTAPFTAIGRSGVDEP